MRKIAIIIALGAAGLTAELQAAGNGSVNFSGNLVSQTCSATVNNDSWAFLTLPTIQVSLLAQTGATAGTTPFTIKLSGCSNNITGANKVKAFFERDRGWTDSDGRLFNTETGSGQDARNVSIQLLDSAGNAIFAGSAEQVTGGTYIPIVDGKAELQYSAQYYANGTATAGKVRGTVKYNIVYN